MRAALVAIRALPWVVGAAAGYAAARWMATPGGAALLAAVVHAAVTAATRRANRRMSHRVFGTVEVPRVLGLPLADAKAALATAGLSVTWSDGDSLPSAPNGVVVTQRPRAGEALAPGARVLLTTSRRVGA